MGNNSIGNLCRDSRDVFQEGWTCSVQVYTYPVYRVLNHCCQCFIQLALVKVMLVLTNPYMLWIYLNKFSQWVLESSTYGGSSSDGYIMVRKVLLSNLRCGIDRCPCLVYNSIGNLLWNFLDQVCYNRLSLS